MTPADEHARSFMASRRPSALSPNETRVIWSEPRIKLGAELRYDASKHRAVVDGVQLAGQWFTTELAGDAFWDATHGEVVLSGPTNIKLHELSRQLTSLTRTPVELNGSHETPITLRVQRTNHGSFTLTVDGQFGWESGEVVGVKFGPASIPVRMTETSFKIARSIVQVGEGRINLASEIQYRPGPAIIRLQPGVVAESIQLTDRMTDGWLRFVIPLVQRVEHIRGTFGVEIDEATLVPDSLGQSRVAGRLKVEHADMSLTPLTRELIGALRNLQDLSPGKRRSTSDVLQGQITMPSQIVEFDLDLGVVNHKSVQFQFDKTRMTSSGDVTLDGKLAIIVEMPKDYVAIGKKPRNQLGKVVSVTVTGSVNQPTVNPTGIGTITTVISSTARNARERLRSLPAEHARNSLQRSAEAIQRTNRLLEDREKIADELQRALEESRTPKQNR